MGFASYQLRKVIKFPIKSCNEKHSRWIRSCIKNETELHISENSTSNFLNKSIIDTQECFQAYLPP